MKYPKLFVFLGSLIAGFGSAAVQEAGCGAFVSEWADPFQWQTAAPASVISPAVVEASLSVAQVSSIAALAVLSPTGVTQGSRLASVSRLISCQGSGEFSTQPLDWLDSPLQISLGDGAFQYLDGAILGNWLIIGGFELVHIASARYFGDAKVHFPGFGVLPVLLFISPLAEFSTTLLRLGNGLEKTAGFASWAGCLSVMGRIAWELLPSRFDARYVKERWRSTQSNAEYVERYGALFEEYEPKYYAFILAEYGMNVLLGGLRALQQSPQVSCKALVGGVAGTLSAFWVGVVLARPPLELQDKVFLGAMSGGEALAALLAAIRFSSESAEENDALQGIAEGIPLALGYISFVKAGVDLGLLGWSLWKGHCAKAELPLPQKWIQPFKRNAMPQDIALNHLGELIRIICANRGY
ncbi:MAG: hypothetical protein I8H72_01105 [Myxococcaceae bacterium]|nr:hypothetical protein [Myxococcaceae bacterium]